MMIEPRQYAIFIQKGIFRALYIKDEIGFVRIYQKKKSPAVVYKSMVSSFYAYNGFRFEKTHDKPDAFTLIL